MGKDFKIESDFMYNGYRCVVLGLSLGHRCGYVMIENPTNEMKNDAYSLNFDVHGGITYGAYSDRYPMENKNEQFWLGFDCAHYGDGKDLELVEELNDLKTYMQILEVDKMFPSDLEVKTTNYVERELKLLVNQLTDVFISNSFITCESCGTQHRVSDKKTKCDNCGSNLNYVSVI